MRLVFYLRNDGWLGTVIDDGLVVFLTNEVIPLFFFSDAGKVVPLLARRLRISDGSASAVRSASSSYTSPSKVVLPKTCKTLARDVRGENFVGSAVVKNDIFWWLIDADFDRSVAGA